MKISLYKPGKKLRAYDGYTYKLTKRPGRDFDEKFEPELTPQKILAMGAFEGKYLNDCRGEFPKEWYTKIKSVGQGNPPDPSINYFGIKSRQSLKHWNKKGWIYGPDKRGWFQWFCRYWLGRRLPEIDRIQIARWRSFRRHRGAIHADERAKRIGNASRAIKKKHRPRQRQALLQWAYNPFR